MGIILTKEKIERSEAILSKKRNTRVGLQVRNKILVFLNNQQNDKISSQAIANGIGISYGSVTYHLKSMLNEKVVDRIIISRRIFWRITGLGQQTIKKWLHENKIN